MKKCLEKVVSPLLGDPVTPGLSKEQSRSSDQCLSRSLLRPKHPERVCWGCDRYCPAGDLRCGNGNIRTPHPIELFGEEWLEGEPEAEVQDVGGMHQLPTDIEG